MAPSELSAPHFGHAVTRQAYAEVVRNSGRVPRVPRVPAPAVLPIGSAARAPAPASKRWLAQESTQTEVKEIGMRLQRFENRQTIAHRQRLRDRQENKVNRCWPNTIGAFERGSGCLAGEEGFEPSTF